MVIKTIEGSEGIVESVVNCNPDVIACFPITPSTHIAEGLNKAYTDGRVKSFIAVEQEFSAISACVGGSSAGSRTFTTTSSQGILLMHEVLWAASGMRLPIVMVVANRAISAPLNIWCDHQDSISQRDNGWLQLYCESNQEAADMVPVAYKIAEDIKLPVMVMMDGFYLTHAVEQIDILDKKIVDNYLPKFKTDIKLDTANPQTLGSYAGPNFYQEFREDIQNDILLAKSKVQKYSKEFYSIIGRHHDNGLFESYKSEDADYVLIAMSSVCGNIKEAVDELREQGQKVGLLRIKCFRPFPYEEVAEQLKGKQIGVFDRALSFGGNSPLYSEIVNALFEAGINAKVSSFTGGLGGRDVTVDICKEMFSKVMKGQSKQFIARRGD